MTDKKISELTSITGADVSDANDVLPIVDTSVATTKKITRAELFKGVSSVDINGGTIDGTVIGGSTPAAISGTTGTFSGNLTVDTDTLFVDATGNRVGVGTSSPATALDVAGTVTADGLTVDGNAELVGNAVSLDLMESDQTDKNLRIRANGGIFSVQTLSDDKNTTTNRLQVSHTTGDISFYEDTGTTPKFFWDASAEALGIGTSSPAADFKLDVNGAFTVGGTYNTATSTNGGGVNIGFDVTNGGKIESLNPTVAWFPLKVGGSDLKFETGGSERMRIDSSGNLLVGTTSNHSSPVRGWFAAPSGGIAVGFYNPSTGAANQVLFVNPNGAVGSIQTNGLATSYNTFSDYRLKEDVQPMVGSVDRLMALKPVNFAWKADGSRVDGFLAHEAQKVVPECVTGQKDQTEIVEIKDEEGNVIGNEERPVYQGIDQSKLVPLLTAALQEALARIETLEAEVAALKGEPAPVPTTE